MYKNKIDNMNNLSGIAIRNLRIEKGWSQRELADALQLLGLDLDKNAIQRIEARKLLTVYFRHSSVLLSPVA